MNRSLFIRKLIVATVFAIILLSFISVTSAFASDCTGSVIFSKDGEGAFMAVFSIDNTGLGAERCEAQGIVAIYDEVGRLLEVSIDPVNADPGESVAKEVSVEFPPGCTAKAFLWDAKTFAPLCDFAVAFITSTPVLTDGGDVKYTNKSSTGITASIDTYVEPVANTEYYYLIAGILAADVYYSGAPENPVGSYFPGSLTTGVLVKTILSDPNLDKYSGILVGNDYKITIHTPSEDRPYTLKIIAYKDGVASEVFTHTFEKISELQKGGR